MDFREYVLKIARTRSIFSAQNAPNSVWRPGSARTRWGSLSAPPDPLAAIRGPTSKGTGGEGEGGRERVGEKGKGEG